MLKGILYYKFENLTVQMGPIFRNWGQSLFRSGLAFQGASAHEDKIVPSLRCVPISASKYPKLLDVSFCCLYIDVDRETGLHRTQQLLVM
jgi:hypothetical protein